MITLRTYYFVFGALLALTLLTTGMAFVDLGAHWNIFVALAIAIVKASLVAAYFMHLRHTSKLTLLVAGAGLIWLVHMLVFTFSDYLTRNW